MFTVADIRFYWDPLILRADNETDTDLEKYIKTTVDNATSDHLDTGVFPET